MKPKIILVIGPTAVGKSKMALGLAQEIGAEIINADSQQVYRYMDIGTEKPSEAERELVRHHIIDVANPDQEFNVAMFCRLAEESIRDIESRGRNVIVCGGTGLYIKALTRGLFVGPAHDSLIRARLKEELETHGLGALYHRLVGVDLAATSRIHPNDQQRIMRALEVYELTGKPMSEWQEAHGFGERPYETLTVALDRERAELYDRINQRCEKMIEAGLLDEVAGLVKKGYGLDLRPLKSVGYRHMGLVLKGEMLLDEAVELMKRDTRRLAKRQLTWFRGVDEIHWYHPNDKAQIDSSVERFLR
ncbi:MAG TPA: tRNA (adenosine(37)-N6)-dimethylallyltransferase MiaA [Candidatus Acidoferrales bacterium]|nr:tRNA (adenosine(37)-N6)-dimethylallyltransferase MiaA [Candidatus Acidoferrales bacterium]